MKIFKTLVFLTLSMCFCASAQTIDLEIDVKTASIKSSGLYGTNCGNNDCGGLNEPDPRIYLQVKHSGTGTWSSEYRQERDGQACGDWLGITTDPGNYTAANIASNLNINLQMNANEPDDVLSGSADANCSGYGTPGTNGTITNIVSYQPSPCTWTSDIESIRRCQSDNVTEDWGFRWAFRWSWNSSSVVSNSSTLAGVISGPTTAADTLICDGGNPAPFANTTAGSIRAGGVFWWQQRINGGAWTDISGTNNNTAAGGSSTYDPPALSVVGGATTLYEFRRIQRLCTNTSTSGTTDAFSNTLYVRVIPDPSAPSATKSPNLVSVCAGTTLTLTNPVKGANPGGACVVYEYRYSTDGGITYSAVSTTVPSIITSVTGTTIIDIRVQGNCRNGCNASPWTSYSWTVEAQPSGPSGGTKSPDLSAVCAGTNLSLSSPTAGTGGCTDDYIWLINGVSQGAYTPGTNIGSGAIAGQTVSIQGRRANCAAGSGCTATAYTTLATWAILAQPAPPSGGAKSPNLTAVCSATDVSLSSINAGTGGIGCADDYIWLIDGVSQGGYTPGANVGSGATVGQTISIQGRRANCDALSGCTGTSYTTLASWTVVAQPTGPSGGTKSPNVATVCAGTNMMLSAPASGSGGSGCADDYIWLVNGVSQGAYSPGTNIGSAATDGQTVSIQGRRANCSALSGCTGTSYTTLASWTVVAQPSSGTVTKSPNTNSVCDGTSVSATFGSNSGGDGCADYQEYRYNGTGSWTAYTGPISTSGYNLVEVRTYRGNCAAGCTSSSPTVASWTILPPFDAGTITGGTEVMCDDNPENIAAGTTPSGAVSYSYKWYYQDGEVACPSGTDLSGWTAIAGATAASYDPPAGLSVIRTYARTVDASGTPDCATETWSDNCKLVFPSAGTVNAISSINASKTCYVSGSSWKYFRNNNGELIAAINANGQDLGLVTISVNVDSVYRSHGNGGLGRNSDCLNKKELSMGRYYVLTVSNTPSSGTTSLRLYYDKADYESYSSSILALPYATAYGLCYGFPISPDDLAVSRNELADMPVSGKSVTTLGSDYIVSFDLSLTPSNLRISGNTGSATQLSGPTTFRFHTEGGIGDPLPVELVSFVGWNEGAVNKLQWITASEKNTFLFEVEKSPVAHSNWASIGGVQAAGNSNAPQNYAFTDQQPLNGNNYYRLKIIDLDGSFEYSNVINIPIGAPAADAILSVYPNPTQGMLNVDIESSAEMLTELKVYDLLGQWVASSKVKIVQGVNKVQLDLSGLPVSSYVLRYDDIKGTRHQFKFIRK